MLIAYLMTTVDLVDSQDHNQAALSIVCFFGQKNLSFGKFLFKKLLFRNKGKNTYITG